MSQTCERCHQPMPGTYKQFLCGWCQGEAIKAMKAGTVLAKINCPSCPECNVTMVPYAPVSQPSVFWCYRCGKKFKGPWPGKFRCIQCGSACQDGKQRCQECEDRPKLTPTEKKKDRK